MQLIYLDSEDDIVSIQDRLQWAGEERVLLVLPSEGNHLTEKLDLMRLRRRADELSLEIGLVTVHGRVRWQARPLGFPVFNTVHQGQNSTERLWRKYRRKRYLVTRNTPRRLMDMFDKREASRRLEPRPGWQQWLWRYVGIMAFFLTCAISIIAFLYAIPTATVQIQPLVEPIRATKQIVADPLLESVNFSGVSVPARTLVVTEEWQATVDTTGTIEVPDAPARGTVIFINTVEQGLTIPAGTRVSTSAGQNIVFQTLRDVEMADTVGATAEVDVVAVQPGPQGNVEPDLINRVEGSLALQLEVRNVEPTTGGGVRVSQAVTQDDRDRLRAQVLQYLQALAYGNMELQLTEAEFLANDSLRVIAIYQETYSHFLGEQTDRLTLEIRAEIHGTAVDASQANDLIYQEMIGNVLPGYELVPSSLNLYSGDVVGVDADGRVSFIMIGEGRMAAVLNVSEPISAITGQQPAVAMAYLNQQLPLRAYPTTDIWPSWFERMPYLPVRIEAEIDTGG
ncbi:MAG: baseplate J/gp47 family protein [Ardenticatenales bacterium]|nr:baseplate J/gp47 family protein [Ardenticatenales bacterium]